MDENQWRTAKMLINHVACVACIVIAVTVCRDMPWRGGILFVLGVLGFSSR